MKVKKISIAAAVLTAMALLVEHKLASNLRNENRALREQIGQLAPLELEHERLTQRAKEVQHASPSTNSQAAELERLRTQVAAQRQEIEHLQSELAGIQPVAGMDKVPFSFRCDSVPRDSWQPVGYGSPEAALQTMLWATLKGDVNAIRSSITPAEESRRMSKEWKGKTDTEIAEDGVQRLANATGFQILKQETGSPDSMHFTVFVNGVPHPEQPLWIDLKKIGDEWKSDGPMYHRD